MTEVTPRFKTPQPEKRRGYNSTLPAPTGYLPRRTRLSGRKTRRAAEDDRTFKTGPRSTLCQRCGQAPAVDASHRGSRAQRPDLRGDPTNRDDLCRGCHEWVEAHPIEATAEGWRSGETYEAANSDPMAKVLRRADA